MKKIICITAAALAALSLLAAVIIKVRGRAIFK